MTTRRARLVLFITILLFFILALASPLSTSAQGVPSPYPTYTFYPTYTLYPTYTFYPTYTPLVRPSNTPTNTRTPNARAATQTQVADDRSATAAKAGELATEVAAYKTIDRRELVSYADKHIGEKVRVQGRVFNIIDDQTLQMYFAGTYEALYIKAADPFTKLYENDNITVYGVVDGYEVFENSLGNMISQPSLADCIIVKR